MPSFNQKNAAIELSKHALLLKKSLYAATLSCFTLSLSACIMDGTPTFNSGLNEGYFMPEIRNKYSNPLIDLPEEYASFETYHSDSPTRQTQVIVPQSYHLSGVNIPPSAKDVDSSWVKGQNPSNYTIQIEDNYKRSQVAKVLQDLPKNQPNVEVRAHSGAYLGLHGSYSNLESAQTELNNLPDAAKAQAKIKQWGSVQKEMDQ